MGTVTLAGRLELDETQLEQFKEKFMELLAMDRSAPEFLSLYREIDAVLGELAEERGDR